ncbi:hypothetical protein Pfo_029193 [Paulownia fortunei]|nr:hypothetical protein Pfo_029193 [Paulownia fortunei]
MIVNCSEPNNALDSCSRSINETVNGSHHFTIRGYSLAKGMGPGRYISSDTFSIGGYEWAIYFYPDGKKPGGFFNGYKRFFRRTSLETSDFLKDDCLSMHCTVGVVRTRVEGPKLYSHLLDSELGCDIIFQVGEESFKAHKLILAARSPVFRAQFFGLVGNPNSDKVELEDALLQFIYSDELPSFHEIIGSTSTLLLKQLCEAKLCEEVSADTVATTLSLAEQHRCPQLKAICLKFAATNLGVVMQSEGFRYLEQSCPSLLSELLETVASVDEKSNLVSGKKRSGSSIFGLDLAADGVAESVNPNGRRLRRRV